MLTPAADFLTYAEAVELYQALQEASITALVKTCGPPSFPFGDGMYYQLLIEEEHIEAARETVAAFEKQRTSVKLPRCLRCGAPEVQQLVRPAWWKRLYYAGTTLYKCQNCGAEFPV